MVHNVATMKDAKLLGGIGSILTLLGGVPNLGAAALVGYVLILIAVKYISDITGDKKIFDNMLISVIALIAGLVIAIIAIIGAVFSTIFVAPHTFTPETIRPGTIILSIIMPLFVVWLALTLGAYYLKKAYDQIAAYTGVDMFKTAGLLYLIGAATSIVIIGLLILLVANILQTIAFFTLPDTYQPRTQSPAQSPPPPPPPTS